MATTQVTDKHRHH